MNGEVGIDEERFEIGFYVAENRNMDSFATFYTDDNRSTIDVTISDCPFRDQCSKFFIPKKDFLQYMQDFLTRIESGKDAYGLNWAKMRSSSE